MPQYRSGKPASRFRWIGLQTQRGQPEARRMIPWRNRWGSFLVANLRFIMIGLFCAELPLSSFSQRNFDGGSMSGIGSVSGRADIAQVLAEMRNLRAQMQKVEPQGDIAPPSQLRPSETIQQGSSFGALLSNAVNSVNQTQMQSSALAKAYEQGESGVSLAQVMIQSQKASVSFQALTQVRNKVVQAYEDIMKMPV
jgi:flagellar hook-basal body complex protein FliE